MEVPIVVKPRACNAFMACAIHYPVVASTGHLLHCGSLVASWNATEIESEGQVWPGCMSSEGTKHTSCHDTLDTELTVQDTVTARKNVYGGVPQRGVVAFRAPSALLHTP